MGLSVCCKYTYLGALILFAFVQKIMFVVAYSCYLFCCVVFLWKILLACCVERGGFLCLR